MMAALATGVVAVIGIAGRASGWLVVDVVNSHVAGAVMLTLALLLLAVCLAPVRGGWRKRMSRISWNLRWRSPA